jgi:ribosomal protein S18 acetylase RimI-like enzyme
MATLSSDGQDGIRMAVGTDLDNPAWWALAGPQRGLGMSTSRAARFDPAVSPFGAFASDPGPLDWADLARLTGPGRTVALIGHGEDHLRPPPGWRVEWEGSGVQMLGDGVVGRPLSGVEYDRAAERPVTLGDVDVPDMLALVAVARPGPFLVRTVEFGGYVGVRHDGRLIAMAGQRLRPPGFTEVSAVATHPEHRRKGLAERLVRAVVSAATARGDVPYLHVADSNANAIHLYDSMGFAVRRTVWFRVLLVPATE